MITSLLFLIAGLALLIKGADLFVEGGGGLAARYGVSSTTIGFTVVAFGTSLPEFVVSINAIVQNDAEIGLGNVIGSNIANIGLILALCAFISPSIVRRKKVEKKLGLETILLMLATLTYGVLIIRGVLDFYSGLIFLAVFAIILYLLWTRGKAEGEPVVSHGKMDYLYTAGGLGAVVIGSQLTLMGAVSIAGILNIPMYVIGLSIVAVGTSLPELATSLVATLKKNTGISVGNIIGSNIFNLLLVLGCGSLIRPIPIPGYTNSIIMGCFTLAVIPLFIASDRITRIWAGLIFVGYFTYIGMLFVAY